jgi:signal transduction histidine kinase
MPDRRRTILCVDDNEAFVDNMREVFEASGYEVRLARSCAEARRQVAGASVALIDVRLPDGDGTHLAAELHRQDPLVQLILLTGFATLESVIEAVRSGATAYLLKPCATAELVLAVEQAVRKLIAAEEKAALERRALLAEKLAAVGTLTAGLSHEIKNPLNAAALQLMVLDRRIGRLPAEAQETLRGPLGLVQHEVTRLNTLLEEFLQFATIRNLPLIPVDAGALLDHIVTLLAEQASQARVTIVHRSSRGPTILAHAPRLEQALMNLVLNALQATPRDGTVSLEVEHDELGCTIAIEDTGPGVPAAIASKIFEPFFTTKSHGSGLGLPLVHRIVQDHGGTISLERGALGGARFVVGLTLAPKDP